MLTGPSLAEEDDALRIGTLFATGGALGSESLARQQAVLLAVKEINDAGGVTAPAGGAARPLVLIGCDASRDYKRAAEHLAAIKVLAIIGPESSQTMLELANNVTIPAGILMVSPVAIASNLSELQDDDLTWLMAPTAKQRAPLISAQLDRLIARLSEARMRSLRLGVVFREDTFGRAALSTLLGLPVDGMSLVQRGAANTGPVVEGYSANTGFDPGGLVPAFLQQVPDALLMIGLTELVNGFIAPLEESWDTKAAMARAPRPLYIMTDGVRVPELLALADARADLGDRLFGTAFVPTGDALPIYESFRAALHTHYPSAPTEVHGVAAAYDAAYTLAYAMASLTNGEMRGPKIATALHERLAGTDQVTVGRDEVVAAFRQLSGGGKVHVLGASGPVRWDQTGARSEGSVEVYCLGKMDGKSYFGHGGGMLDVATGKVSGEFVDCYGRGGNTPSKAPSSQPAAGEAGTSTPNPAGSETSGAAAGAPAAQPAASTAAVNSVGATAAVVHCGATECDSNAQQTCCIADLRLQTGGPRVEDYSCATRDVDCAAELHCGNDAACDGGLICCGSGSTAACSSGLLCELRIGVHLGCTAQRDCSGAAVCCANPCIPGPAGFCELSCQSSCDASLGANVVCESDADCRSGLHCRVNPAWLGVKVCQP